LLVEYERNTTIMEAEDAEALMLHLISSTWYFRWLKGNNYFSKWLHGEAADVDLIAVADGIAKLQKKFLTNIQKFFITWMKLEEISVYYSGRPMCIRPVKM